MPEIRLKMHVGDTRTYIPQILQTFDQIPLDWEIQMEGTKKILVLHYKEKNKHRIVREECFMCLHLGKNLAQYPCSECTAILGNRTNKYTLKISESE